MMPETKACGFLLIRGDPIESFLLMKHPTRWDLPKGHLDAGETDLECAFRETVEETGIEAGDIELDPDFRFTIQYHVTYKKRFEGRPCLKTVIIFLGRLKRDLKLSLTEHEGFQWFPWNPPHRIQKNTIDPLLAELAAFLERKAERGPRDRSPASDG
jgi:bis(5'-nucleosidyl)-tetraphosphatase